MSLAPVVGALVGLVQAGTGLGLLALGTNAFAAAVLTVAAGALATRGLHLDGLADTADGLGGGQRSAEKALTIMRKPDIGPFGVVTLILVLAAQVAAVAGLLTRPAGAALAAVVAAAAGGRVAIALTCRRGVTAARPDGLGALVAGTVPLGSIAVAAIATAAVAIPAVPGRLWQGPLAVGLGLLVATTIGWHLRRRLGGITGDVLGAVCELTVTVIYLVASM